MNATDFVLAYLDVHSPHAVSVRNIVWYGELVGFRGGSVRTALSRASSKGDIEHVQDNGRRAYCLPEGSATFNLSTRFEAQARAEAWDGTWIQLLLHVGSRHPRQRRLVQQRLSLMRLRSPYRGVWTRPANVALDPRMVQSQVQALCPEARTDVLHTTMIDAEAGRRWAAELWELDKMGARMRELMRTLGELTKEWKRSARDELFEPSWLTCFAAVRLMSKDPLLPPELLPKDWPGDRLRKAFVSHGEVLAPRLLDVAYADTDASGLVSELDEKLYRRAVSAATLFRAF